MVVIVVAVGIAIGAGLLLRTSGELAVTRAAREHDLAVTSSDRSRQHECDVVAREAHDTLGHQLTLLALHAGALEATGGSPSAPIAEQAAQIRSLASNALRDVRGLVDLLQDPDPISTVEGRGLTADGHEIGLTQLPALLGEARQAGMVIASNIYFTDTTDLNPAYGRAVYRIVQESLTNARKHAPGQMVDVDITAGSATGIDIVVANMLLPEAARFAQPTRTSTPTTTRASAPAPEGTSPGRGLTGIVERASLLHGHVEHGPGADGRFRIAVHLPWDRITV